jgi:hypothetical protein
MSRIFRITALSANYAEKRVIITPEYYVTEESEVHACSTMKY